MTELTLEQMLARHLGSKVEEMRTNHNLSQRELGERLALSEQVVKNIERGWYPEIRLSLIARIAAIFEVPVSNLFPRRVTSRAKQRRLAHSSR